MTSSLARMMAIKYSIYSRQQSRRLSVSLSLSAPLDSFSHSWMKLQAPFDICLCVRACVPHNYFWPKTDKRKKTCRIYYYDCTHRDHMQIIFGAAKDATKGQWGVRRECELWGSRGATVRQQMRHLFFQWWAWHSLFFFFSLCQLNSMRTLQFKPNIKSTNKPFHIIIYGKWSSVWGFPSRQYVNHAA